MNETHIAERVARRFVSNREYSRGCSADIAYEVLNSKVSSGWVVPNEKSPSYRRTLEAAKETESMLAQFNIGYTDDMRGSWSYVKGGTKNFQSE